MTLSDAIALAKAGYKKADIERMRAEEAKQVKEPEAKEPEAKEPEAKEPEAKEPEPKDFEKLYQDALSKLEETNKELKSLQDDFKNKDMSDRIKSKEDMYKDTLDALY